MKPLQLQFVFVGLLTIAGALSAPAREWPEIRAARPVENAENHLDVVYLPERLCGGWEDRWLKMNIHVPKGEGPFPAIIFIHGGGWSSGDKDGKLGGASSPDLGMVARAVREGYVAINLNYILKNGGHSRPQVYWDHRAAVRFLRKNAEQYRIDPDRLASWGFSAGGWLTSGATFSDAGDLFDADGPRGSAEVLVPLDDPRPVYGQFNSRLKCVVADFWQFPELLRTESPALLTYVGEGAKHKWTERAGGRGGSLTQLVLTCPKCQGQSQIHMPGMDTPAQSLKGNHPSKLQDEVFHWLAGQFDSHGATTPPETRPNRRSFRDRVEISLIAASPDAKIHYTLDGSAPTLKSPLYQKPLVQTASTTIKAIAVRPQAAPSAVVTATYALGKFIEIAAPVDLHLPAGNVGEPYERQFTASAQCVWSMAGHNGFGLSIDAQTGVLSGRPTEIGIFTFQIQAAPSAGEVADARTYVLHVK